MKKIILTIAMLLTIGVQAQSQQKYQINGNNDETHIARDGQRLLYINEQGNAVIIDNYFEQL